MKKTVMAYAGMLLVSLVILSATCVKGPVTSTDNSLVGITGSWDYSIYYSITYDSVTATSYAETIYDTSFAVHSQNSYQFEPNDSVIYTDYTITPNVIKRGTYSAINIVHGPFYTIDTSFADYYIGTMGSAIIQFPLQMPDTMDFRNYPGSTQIEFLQEIHQPHTLTRNIKYHNAY